MGESAAETMGFGSRFTLSGDAKTGDDGVVLTEAELNQVGSATCNEVFADDKEIKIKFTFGMSGGNGADGIAVGLLDADNPDHMKDGWEGGNLGLVGRPGAVICIGFDAFGNFLAGDQSAPNTITVKKGEWGDWAPITSVEKNVQKEDVEVKIKFDLDDDVRNMTMEVDGEKIIDELIIEGLKLPPNMKVCFCASTGGMTNRHIVKDLKVKD